MATRFRPISAFALLALFGLSGCDQIFPYRATPSSQDGQLAADGRRTDSVAAIEASPDSAAEDAAARDQLLGADRGTDASTCPEGLQPGDCREKAGKCNAECGRYVIDCQADTLCTCSDGEHLYTCAATGTDCSACQAAFDEGCCAQR